MTHLLGLLGVLSISFAAIFVRLSGVSPATAAFFRAIYALPVLYAVARFGWAPMPRSRALRRAGFISGLLLALDLTLWHQSIALIGVGLATVLVNVQVIIVAAAAWILYHERPTALAFVTVPIVLTGVVLVSGLGRPDAFGDDPVGGVLFGVLAGASYAAYLLTFRAATTDRMRAERAAEVGPRASRNGTVATGPLFDVTVGTAVGAALIGPPFDPGFSLSIPLAAHDWLVILAVLCQCLGWLLIAVALPRLPALETSVILLTQPIWTVLWGRWFFEEQVSTVQGAGIGLMLGGIALLTLKGSIRRTSNRKLARDPQMASRL